MNNTSIRIKETELLSDNWYVLNKITYEYQNKQGEWETHSREAYDRGNGATILLYNQAQKTAVLDSKRMVKLYGDAAIFASGLVVASITCMSFFAKVHFPLH